MSQQTEAVFAFLTALSDPETMKAKLAEYEALEAKIAARTAALGLVGEVEALVARAKSDRHQAAELKAQTEAKAEASSTALLTAHADLERRQGVLEQERRAFDAMKANEARTAKARDEALAERELAVRQAEARANTMLEQAAVTKAAADARLAKLKEAAAQAGA